MSADGTWKITMQTPAGAQAVNLDLHEEGDVLTGMMSSDTDPNTTAVSDGTVKGNDLTWNIAIAQPMPVTLEFTGTVSDDSMSGNVKFGSFGQGAFEGTRT